MYEIATRAIITIMFTLFINKLLSSLRIRQLYVAVEEILDCHDINIEGYTASITVYNRGKDKEKGIEVLLPETTLCQVISQSSSGVSFQDNCIKIDRLAPNETISLTVFIKGHNKLSKSKLPKVKSEDTTGRAFWGKANVWPSLGPLVLTTSIILGVFSITAYMAWSAGGPDKAYYSIRYRSLHQQGFTPSIVSDNHIISKSSIFEKTYPFKVESIEALKKNIKFVIRLTNTEKNPQKIEIRISGIDMEYYYKSNKLQLLDDATKEEIDALRNEYSVPDNAWQSSETTVNPGETKSITFLREITPNLKASHIAFQLSIKGRDDSGESYHDRYDFTANSSFDIVRELKLSE